MKHFKLIAGFLLASSLSFAIGHWTGRGQGLPTSPETHPQERAWQEIQTQLVGLSQQLSGQTSSLRRLEESCETSRVAAAETKQGTQAPSPADGQRTEGLLSDARKIVAKAIQVGRWTEADVRAFRHTYEQMSASQRQEARAPLLRALNDGSLKLVAREPL